LGVRYVILKLQATAKAWRSWRQSVIRQPIAEAENSSLFEDLQCCSYAFRQPGQVNSSDKKPMACTSPRHDAKPL